MRSGSEAGAFDAGGDFEIAEFGHGAVDVERLDDARAGAAVAVGSGGVDDERDAGAAFEKRAGLGPLSFFAELIAVVGDEDDDGVVAQAEFVEMREDAAEIPVSPGDGGEVGADDLSRFGLGCAAADEEIGVAHADGGFGKAFGHGGPGGEVGRKLDVVGVVEIEEALRCGGRAVRFGEAAADEEGLVRIVFCALVEVGDGAVGHQVVACTFAVAFEDEDLIGVSGALIVGGEDGQDAVGHGDARVRDVHRLAGLRRVHGFDVAVEVGPGFVIVEAGVEEFAAAQGGVSVFAEELRESDPVGMQVADAGAVAEDLGGVGRMAGEERRTRRVAERELAVVAIEANAFGGECVDVGTVGVEAAVVAGELGAHVVGHEEEDVEGTLAGVSGGGFGCGLV